jgi:FKBP-type peptidyl-prolyl cis-trans isomerase FkpA
VVLRVSGLQLRGMLQKKYFVLIGVVVVVAGLSGGGFVLWKSQQPKKVDLGTSFDSMESAEANAGGSASDASGQDTSLSASSSDGLSIDSSPSSGNLGQLSVGQNSSGSASSGASGAASSSGDASSSSEPTIDPSTFSQYNKYQSGTSALYGDVQVGTGTTLTSGHQATVYYKGWLTNGTLFDESKAGSNGQLQPFTFTLGAGQVIEGWEQGLAGMKVGGTRLLIVPPAVGYGAAGKDSIPGNSVLVFEVQLLAVQ